METKRLITLMMISFVVIFGWQLLIFKLYPPKPPGQATTQPAPTTNMATTACHTVFERIVPTTIIAPPNSISTR